MRNKEQREGLMEKLVDAFDKRKLAQIIDSYRDTIEENILILVSGEVEKIIDVYEKEHIVKELLKLHKKNPEDLAILHRVAVNLLTETNWLVFHDKRTKLDKKAE